MSAPKQKLFYRGTLITTTIEEETARRSVRGDHPSCDEVLALDGDYQPAWRYDGRLHGLNGDCLVDLGYYIV